MVIELLIMFLKTKIYNRFFLFSIIYIYMPFYNNSRIGGAMDGTHIYYNTNIANDWASKSIRPFTIWENRVYQVGEYVYQPSNNTYYICVANYTNPNPQPAPPAAGIWTSRTLAQMTVYNNTTDKNEIINFNQTRAQPYLADPSEYYMSVQRLTIESISLPLFIPQGRVGSAVPIYVDLSGCETIYQITLKNETTGFYTTKPVKWYPQDETAPVNQLGATLTPADLLDPLFYCYSYAYFISLINRVLQEFTGANHPLMQFDPRTGLFSIQGFQDRWRTTSTGTPLGTTNPTRLFFNTALYNLFSSLSAIYTAIPPSTPGAESANYQILFTTGSDSPFGSQPYITNIVPDTYHNIAPLIPTLYINSINYVIGDKVTFSGIYYEVITNNPAVSVAPPNASYWVVIPLPSPVPPTYLPANSYIIGDKVEYFGVYYQATANNPTLNIPPPNATYWKVTTLGRNDVINTQEYTTLPLWSPVKSIVYTASLLNVVSEMVATPVVYEQVFTQGGGQTTIPTKNINAGKPNTDILPILTEFSVPQTTGTEYKPFIFYEPQGEYRLSDLYSDIPIAGLQYKVFWKDSLGNLNPLKLGVGASTTLKILFRRKNFNSDKL
jgi:hypothetical protein